MKRWLAMVLKAGSGLLVAGGLTGGGLAMAKVRAFDESMDRVYDVPLPAVAVSRRPRGARARQAPDRVGRSLRREALPRRRSRRRRPVDMGPRERCTGPNVTQAPPRDYSDGELARLLHHGHEEGRPLTRVHAGSGFCLAARRRRRAPSSRICARCRWSSAPTASCEHQASRQDPRPPRRRSPRRRAADRPHDRRARQGRDADGRIWRGSSRWAAKAVTASTSAAAHSGAPSSVPIPLNLTPDQTGLSIWTLRRLQQAPGPRRDEGREAPRPVHAVPVVR